MSSIYGKIESLDKAVSNSQIFDGSKNLMLIFDKNQIPYVCSINEICDILAKRNVGILNDNERGFEIRTYQTDGLEEITKEHQVAKVVFTIKLNPKLKTHMVENEEVLISRNNLTNPEFKRLGISSQLISVVKYFSFKLEKKNLVGDVIVYGIGKDREFIIEYSDLIKFYKKTGLLDDKQAKKPYPEFDFKLTNQRKTDSDFKTIYFPFQNRDYLIFLPQKKQILSGIKNKTIEF